MAVAQYCQVTLETSAQVNTLNVALHPMMVESLQIIDDYWEDFIVSQGLFDDEKGQKRVLEEIKLDDEVKRSIQVDMEKCSSSDEVWQVLMQYSHEHEKRKLGAKKRDANFL